MEKIFVFFVCFGVLFCNSCLEHPSYEKVIDANSYSQVFLEKEELVKDIITFSEEGIFDQIFSIKDNLKNDLDIISGQLEGTIEGINSISYYQGEIQKLENLLQKQSQEKLGKNIIFSGSSFRCTEKLNKILVQKEKKLDTAVSLFFGESFKEKDLKEKYQKMKVLLDGVVDTIQQHVLLCHSLLSNYIIDFYVQENIKYSEVLDETQFISLYKFAFDSLRSKFFTSSMNKIYSNIRECDSFRKAYETYKEYWDTRMAFVRRENKEENVKDYYQRLRSIVNTEFENDTRIRIGNSNIDNYGLQKFEKFLLEYNKIDQSTVLRDLQEVYSLAQKVKEKTELPQKRKEIVREIDRRLDRIKTNLRKCDVSGMEFVHVIEKIQENISSLSSTRFWWRDDDIFIMNVEFLIQESCDEYILYLHFLFDYIRIFSEEIMLANPVYNDKITKEDICEIYGNTIYLVMYTIWETNMIELEIGNIVQDKIYRKIAKQEIDTFYPKYK